jgi:hypothetical protein
VTKLDDRDHFQPVSWLNEAAEFRDRTAATVLHRWPKQVPLRATIEDALAHVEVLLGKLEAGVHIADGDRQHAERTIRALYLVCQDMTRVLRDAAELDLQ